MEIFDLLNACIEHSHVIVIVVIVNVVVMVVLLGHVVVLIVVVEGDLICFELSGVKFLRKFLIASVCFGFFINNIEFLRRFVVRVG